MKHSKASVFFAGSKQIPEGLDGGSSKSVVNKILDN